MFIEQKKKKQYRTYIYAALIVVLCLIILVVAWPQESTANERNDDTEVYNPGDFIGKNDVNRQEEDIDEKDDEPLPDEKIDISTENAAYYLVRRDGESIKVYFVDENSSEIELETTEIIYEMLGPEDQKLFDEGYRVHTQEELAVLLQDFES